MTETIRFVDGINYTEGDMATFNRRMRPEGVLQDSPLGILAVTSIGGFGMRVSHGDVFIQGFLYTNDANKDLTIGGNSSGSTRIDTIIIRVSPTANTATAVVLVGTPGAGAPTLTQSPGGTWEYPLYNVTVANGAGSLSGANLTDRRTWSVWGLNALTPLIAEDVELGVETSARIAADNAEATTRANADTAEATARAGVQTNLNAHAALTTHVKAYARGLTNSGGGSSAGVAVNFGFATITRTGTASIDFVFSSAAGSTNYVAIGNSATGSWVVTGIATTGFSLSWGASDGHWEIIVVGG